MKPAEVTCSSWSGEEDFKLAGSTSPHYNSIMYAKLRLYEGSINGWGRCNCLKQGISLSLMSRGSLMGLFTLLLWQGAGVIRNTNPLINFWSGGSLWSKRWIAESAAWNNACVICRLTEFAALIWLYYEVESLKVFTLLTVCPDWLKKWINNAVIRRR